MSINIPYQYKQSPYFGKICDIGLVVEVWLPSIGYQPFEFALDSGADCTIVPRYLAGLVGIRLPPTTDAELEGVDGMKMPAYKGHLKLRIGSDEFTVRCLFTESDETPFLLGRVDFFSLFNVQFDNRNNQIVLERLS